LHAIFFRTFGAQRRQGCLRPQRFAIFLSPTPWALNIIHDETQGSGFAVTLGYTLSPLRGSLVAHFVGFIEFLQTNGYVLCWLSTF